MESEVLRLRQELAEAREAAGKAAEREGQALARVAETEARAEAAEARLLGAGEDARMLRAERDGLDARQRDLAGRLSAAEAELAERTPTPLGTLLRERGLHDAQEDAAALLALLEQRAEELVEALELASAGKLRQLLDERVALVCGKEGCQPEGPTAAVRVAPGRCEVCGGSDVQGAFSRFLAAAEKGGVAAIVLVGGSPAYRRQLRALADLCEGRLRIDLVSGTSRRPRHKADADLRRADVVVIWGATMLDHSVSEAYREGPARILRIPHRGITRMLDAVRADILRAAREERRRE